MTFDSARQYESIVGCFAMLQDVSRVMTFAHVVFRPTDLLRTALLRGGVEQATLDLLTTAQDGADTSHEFSNIKDGRDKYSSNHYPPSLVPIAISKPGGSASHADTLSHNTSAPGSRAIPYNRVSSFGTAASSNDSTSKDEFGIAGGQIRSTVSISSDQRTLVFGNLSEKVTHKDLTNIIRGGRLLDIYIRHDRSGTCAFVSFAEGATEFFAYAKRNDFYLHAKRVRVLKVSINTFAIL
jgi:hypothetical protein